MLSSMMARLVLLGGACLLVSGSQYSCTARSGSVDDDGKPDSGFIVTLVLRDSNGTESSSFMFGAPIRFDLTVKNRANQSATLQFNDGHTNDYLVVDSGTARMRWLWSQNMAFTQATQQVTFDPLQTRTFTVTWNGVLNNGNQIMPGTYQARGVLVFDGFTADPMAANELGSDLKSFTVR
jgi:hypothetical protein